MVMLNGCKTSYTKMLLTTTGKQSKRHRFTWKTRRKRIKIAWSRGNKFLWTKKTVKT
jgi:hypothetical protein